MSIADVRDPPAAVSGRASWTGQLELGPLKLPVKAYPALVTPTNGPLHQIHTACGRRISQRKVCPEHGELATDAIGKAFELSPEQSIALTANELASLSPDDDSSIRIEHLLPLEKIDLSLLSGRMLFLAPTQPAVELLYARAIAALD
jgi:non-homologous end joining protein Ku